MKLLDRYVIKELLTPFVFGIFAFTFILTGSTILPTLIGETIKYGIPIHHFAQLFLLKLPYIFSLSFPMSMLLATILAFGRLGNDLEILAFRAGGVSIFRLVIPVILTGLLVSILTIWFNESIVPKASFHAENLFRSYRDSDKPTVKQNVNLTEYKQGLPSRIINVSEIDKGILKNVTIAEYETGKLARLIRSETGKLIPTGGWEFYDGVMHNFNLNDPKKVTVIEFKKEHINIQLRSVDLSKRKKKVEEMTRAELRDRIERKLATGDDALKDLMDYHMKLSIAFASLIYSILGASVGLRPHRSSSGLGLGISLFIIFIYIILLSIGMGLGLSGSFPPLLAAWIPNVIIGGAGLLLLRKVGSY